MRSGNTMQSSRFCSASLSMKCRTSWKCTLSCTTSHGIHACGSTYKEQGSFAPCNQLRTHPGGCFKILHFLLPSFVCFKTATLLLYPFLSHLQVCSTDDGYPYLIMPNHQLAATLLEQLLHLPAQLSHTITTPTCGNPTAYEGESG